MNEWRARRRSESTEPQGQPQAQDRRRSTLKGSTPESQEGLRCNASGDQCKDSTARVERNKMDRVFPAGSLSTNGRARRTFALKRKKKVAVSRKVREIQLVPALAFALAMALVRWPQVFVYTYGQPLRDRHGTARRLESFSLTYDYRDYDGLLSYWSNEYLFGWFLRTLHTTLGLGTEVSFGVISFFAVLVSALLVLKFSQPAFLLLLLNPHFIAFAYSQLRLALALALLAAIIAFGVRNVFVRTALLVAGVGTHTAAIGFLLMYLAASWIQRPADGLPSGADYRRLAALSIALGAAESLVRRGGLLEELGDRRAGLEYSNAPLALFAVWVVFWFLSSIEWRRARWSVAARYSMVLFWMLPFLFSTGGYPQRYVAASTPLLVAGVYPLSSRTRLLALVAYVGYDLILWSRMFLH